MPTEGTPLFRTREEIIADLEAGIRARIPDVYWGEEGVLRIIMEIVAGSMESVFLANQIVSEDMFVQTANPAALDRHGDEKGVSRKAGIGSTGTLRFSGAGGTIIPIGSEVAYDPGTGDDPLYFLTTSAGTIPNPGTPTAPTAVVNVAAGNLTGLYEYAVTFLTAAGETEIGAESVGVNPAAQKVDLSAIPLGGAGTTGRRIYRQKDGDGIWRLVTTLADNVTVVFTDNVADGAVGGNPPVDSTAERITVNAASEESGVEYNVLAGAITQLTDVPDGVTDVINTAPFAGATDPEATEDYRLRLLDAIRNPGTGSPGDIKTWAEEINGVESATVFPNDNLGVTTAGHVTVRIMGPGGTIPDAATQTAVLNALVAKDLAQITFHVGTFTAVPTNVGVTVTLATGYTLADVTPGMTAAISNYINSLAVGETLRVAGIYDAGFGLPGVLDVVVTTPASNQATGATSKRTVGVITVS